MVCCLFDLILLSQSIFFQSSHVRMARTGLNWHLAGFNVSCLSCLFVVVLWSSIGQGLTSWLPCMWCFLVFISPSHTVSWVMCGTWLYRFLTFAFFFTLLNDNMQFNLWGSNPQPLYLDSNTLPLDIALAYCVVIMMKVSDYYYDLGVKGLGQIYLPNVDVNYFFIFVRGCPCIAKWFLKVGTLKWRFRRTNMTLGLKVNVFRIGPTARDMNFCGLW